MEKNDLILWTDGYSVNVAEIDEQHKYFIGIINELYSAVEEENVHEVIDDILNKLSAYIDFHFATEEKYFDLYHYPDADEHKNEHQILREKFAAILQKRKLDDNSVFYELISFLNGWLEDHLARVDKKYSKFFNEHGLK